MQKEYIDLFTLQSRLKAGVESIFPSRVWVKAEISSLGVKANGHCYMEICESDPGGTIVAKSRAVIWASRFNYIDQYFKSMTGSPLAEGMEILARVQVSYHVVFGFILVIDEVDPEFTLGEKELQRQKVIERLDKEGLLKLQKRLRLPLLPYSLAVISASGAAGYGDFCHHLKDNEYGYVFDVKLFEATMQGESAPESIIAALSAIISGESAFDAVLIMRGGGSELDLACFDDYDLAAAIAHCPVPVFTAIGHDKDYHVADMVANTFVKTPTALADLFLDCFIAEDQRITTYETRLMSAFSNRLSSMTSKIDLQESRLQNVVESRIVAQEHRLDRFFDRIVNQSGRRVDKADAALDRMEQKVFSEAGKMVAAALSDLMMKETRIFTTDPRNILKKGFVLALDGEGRKMNSATESHVGDRLQMMFADGTVKCGVVEVDIKDNIPEDEASVQEMRESI